MEEFRKLGCDIILTASRASGYTFDALENLRTQSGYTLITVQNPRVYLNLTAPYNPIRDNLNGHGGMYFAKLVEDIAFGKI